MHFQIYNGAHMSSAQSRPMPKWWHPNGGAQTSLTELIRLSYIFFSYKEMFCD